MDLPKIPPETPTFLWGAAIGAISLAVVGFNWGGWVTGGTAEKLAEARADKAMVTALTPVCVDQFRKAANAPATLKTLNGLSTWERADYVRKGGWASMPGGVAGESNEGVISACVDALNKLVL